MLALPTPSNPAIRCQSEHGKVLSMMFKVMAWLFLLQFLLPILSVHAKIPALIVFGDSTVDSGNNNHVRTILKSNFQPYGQDFNGGQPTGRFSNGRLPTDFISEALGLKPAVPAYLDPAYHIKDFASGVCFASAGTGYDNATSSVLSVIPLWKELEYYKEYQKQLRDYLGNQKANEILSESLYTISLGTNDFLENYYLLPSTRSKFSVEDYQSFLLGIAGNFITELFHLGARKITVAGLPPMGCLPLERTINTISGRNCVERYNNVARDFNKKLQEVVVKLKKELSGITLVQANVYDILLEIIQSPNSFGFEEAAIACCSTGRLEMGYMCNRFTLLTCTDADKYVFWDAFHPTEKTNRIVADYVVKHFLAEFL